MDGLDFDLDNIETIDFGIGRLPKSRPTFYAVSTDASVKDALRAMVEDTWELLGDQNGPFEYNPAEKHATKEYLYLPLESAVDTFLPDLYRAGRLPRSAGSLRSSSEIFCYFAVLADASDRRLLALRGASYFKALQKKSILFVATDSVKLMEHKPFVLDADFDLMVDSGFVHILRPSSFESLVLYSEQVQAASHLNVESISAELPFVEFGAIAEYASSHSRAARYLASIRTHELAGMDSYALRDLCDRTGVSVSVSDGRLTVSEGHYLQFLEVLDRRRYEVELISGNPEQFRASSRDRISR